MWAPRRSDLVLVAGAGAAAAVLVLLDDQGWAEWVFGTFLLTCLAVLGRLGVESWRSAHAERLRAQRLAGAQPAAVAQQAVTAERARLAVEVEVCIRDSLRQVAAEIENVPKSAPVAALRHVHALTRRTTSELRRQLGLLRDADTDDVAAEPGETSTRGTVSTGRAVGEALVMACFAAVESTAHLLTEGPTDWLPWSVLVSALAASTIVGRGSRTVPALLVLTGLIVAGSLLGHPVTSGFWIAITLGVLLWTLAADPDVRAGFALTRVATATLLFLALSWAFGRDDPGNLGILLVIMVIVLLGGLLVGHQRRGEERARQAAHTRERVLGDAVDEAVRAERGLVARELHDVVSHAVGVIALQAGAAQMSWPHDPAAVRRAVEVIRRTTSDTLAELERMPVAGAGAERDVEDLLALVDRVRMAGTPVDLTVVGDLAVHADVVHRVVQESLTNAMRHAPGASVAVRVHAGRHSTEVSVRDDGPGPGEAPRRGYGLVGLAERVAFAHGSFECGPGPRGRGFHVVASIPHVEALDAT